jgi:methionyl-tRNA formyltransferase
MRPDVGFVVGCRVIIPKAIWEQPRLGMLAVHDSLLPRYRGFAPINWSILNAEVETGVTLFYLGEGVDAGDIVAQKTIAIAPTDTAPAVYERVCGATVDLILESCPGLASGNAPRIHQDPGAASFSCSRSPADGEINWTKSTVEIFNKIRALSWPYPGAYTFYESRKLMLWQAAPVEDAPCYVGRIPGRVISVSGPQGDVQVLTGDGVLRVIEVEYPGHGKVPAASIIRSVRVTLGLNTGDLLARIEELERIIGSNHDS